MGKDKRMKESFHNIKGDFIEKAIDRRNDVVEENEMLLAVVVNKMPENFVKIRTINVKDSLQNLLETHKLFLIKPLIDEFKSVVFTIPAVMWFDFGCPEEVITDVEYGKLSDSHIAHMVAIKKFIELSKLGKESDVRCTSVPLKTKVFFDDSVFEEGDESDYNKIRFNDENIKEGELIPHPDAMCVDDDEDDDDDDDEMIPFKDEGEDSESFDNTSSCAICVVDDDDDDDEILKG